QADMVRATLVAERVLAALKPSFVLAGQPIGVEASIGIVIYPQHGQTAEALLRQAGVAMGRAKRSSSGYLLYTGSHDQHDLQRLVLLAELRLAIERDELELYYQPKVRLPAGDLAGVEAL